MTRSSDYLTPGSYDGFDLFSALVAGVFILGVIYGGLWIWDQFLEAGERLAEMGR